ncbi:MAG: response regulator [Candidatus Omnitrophica bacterium]|nr:response regulator [Candidatus Omnitrophota bacterium]
MKDRASHTRKKRILAVDDDGLVRKTLELLLREAGYEPVMAAGGQEALDLLPREDFDLVITDIRMPGVDGLQVIRAVRDYYGAVKKPVPPMIVLTAYQDEPVQTAAARLGVKDFILKPFKLEEFLKALRCGLGT